MKQLLKFLLFLLLLFVACCLSQVPSYSHIVFPICVGLSVLLIIGTLIYIRFGFKKNILSALIAALIILPLSFSVISIPSAYAEDVDQDAREEAESYISAHEQEVCDASKSKEVMYEQHTLDKANKIMEYSKTIGKTDGEAFKCAEKYAGKAEALNKQKVKKCSPIASLIKSYLNKDSCWPCDITGIVISSIQRVAIASYEVIRTAALSTLGVMFLFWLAYVTLTFFGKFGFARVSEYLTNVLNKSVLVLFIATLLHMPIINAYQFIISPFVQYASGLAISMSEFSQKEVKDSANMITTIADLLSGSPDCDYCSRTGSTQVLSNQFLDVGTVNSILCSVCTVYKQVTPMISLGQALMCYATSAPTSYHDITSVSEQSSFAIPSISGYFVGLLFVALFSLLMVIVGFHIMAATMKLGFVVILMPFWLVFYAFKPTRLYTSKAWVLVVHSMVTFVALSIAIALILVGFNHILTNKVILGFALMAMIKSPTEMLASFAGVFQGTDPLSSGESEEGESWASGFTESLVSFAIGQFTDFSPTRTMVVLASYCMLSIGLIDKAAQYVERLTNAYIQLSSTDASNMVGGIGAALGTAAVAGRMTGVAAKKGKDALLNKASSAAAAVGAGTAAATGSRARAAQRYEGDGTVNGTNSSGNSGTTTNRS